MDRVSHFSFELQRNEKTKYGFREIRRLAESHPGDTKGSYFWFDIYLTLIQTLEDLSASYWLISLPGLMQKVIFFSPLSYVMSSQL